MVDYTPHIECDFDVNGTWDTDITADIVESGYQISRGYDSEGRIRTTQIQLELRNNDGKYTPYYSSSSLYGKVVPQVPIRVTITIGITDYTLWTGYIKSISNRWTMTGGNVGPRARATLVASDIGEWLTSATVKGVTVADRQTGAALTAIFTDIGLSAPFYSVDTGASTLSYHFVRNQPAPNAILDVVNSEMGGAYYLDAAGVLQFKDRHHWLGIAPDLSAGDGTTIVPNEAVFVQNIEDLVSIAQVTPTIRVTGQDGQEVWRMSRNAAQNPPNGIYIPAGGVYGPVQFDYVAPLEALTTPVASKDYQFTANQDGTGTDLTADMDVVVDDLGAGFSIQINNTGATGAYCKFFRLRGQPVPFVADTPTYEFGKSTLIPVIGRTATFTVPFTDDGTICRDYAMQMLRTYRYQYPWLTLTFKWGNDDIANAMAALEIGDQVYYVDTAVDVAQSAMIDEWWRVMAIDHTHRPKTLPVTVVKMVPCYLYRDLDHIVYDLFTRDDTANSLGVSTSDDTWTTTTWKIHTNKAVPTSNPSTALVTVGGSGDMVVEAQCEGMDADVDAQGVYYRYKDATHYWRAVLDASTQAVQLWCNDPAYFGLNKVADVSWTRKASAEIRVLVQGDRHRVYVDGVLYIEWVDSHSNTETIAGLYYEGINPTTRAIDDFYCQGL